MEEVSISSRVEDIFRCSLSLLRASGELIGGEEGRRIVTERGGVTIEVKSPYDASMLGMATRDGTVSERELVLRAADRIRITVRGGFSDIADSLVVTKFDPDKLVTIPEEEWKFVELRRGGIQYSVVGNQGETKRSLRARIKTAGKLLSCI